MGKKIIFQGLQKLDDDFSIVSPRLDSIEEVLRYCDFYDTKITLDLIGVYTVQNDGTLLHIKDVKPGDQSCN
tara:strand:+ start:343 stop:558 length:216 start_codon:yes stop_codon:yes gene_type:complete